MLRLQRVRPEDAYQGWDERESYFLMELEKRDDVDMDMPLPKGEFSKLAIGEKNRQRAFNVPGRATLFFK